MCVYVFRFRRHTAYFRRVDLIHFAGQQQQCKRNLLVVLFSEINRFFVETVEVGDSKVLRIASDFFIVREDPPGRVFSILIIKWIDGVGWGGGWVVVIFETGHGSMFFEHFGWSIVVGLLELDLHVRNLVNSIKNITRIIRINHHITFRNSNRRILFSFSRLTINLLIGYA